MRANVMPASRKRRRFAKLAIKEVRGVLRAVKVDYLTFESAAILYNTNASTVGRIVRSFKHKPDYEGELMAARAKKEGKVNAAISTI